MRWRFTDSVDNFKPWQSIAARKVVSFEEACLQERTGRPGVLPESIIIECCIQAARWLVAVSSKWELSCILQNIRRFEYKGEVRMGDILNIAINTIEHGDDSLTFDARIMRAGHLLAEGRLVMNPVPLGGLLDPQEAQGIWRELYGKA